VDSGHVERDLMDIVLATVSDCCRKSIHPFSSTTESLALIFEPLSFLAK
jgi:hypothetical protein